MAGSVFLDDFQQKHLVVGDRKLGQREYRPLTLMSPYNGRIVAYAQDFERCLLLCRTLCELLVGYDKLSCIHLKGDIRVIIFAKLLQKSEMRKDIVIELSYKGFG